MKTFKKILLVLGLFLCLIYVSNISNIPKNIVLIQGEKLDLSTIFGIKLYAQKNEPTVYTDAKTINENGIEKNYSIYQQQEDISKTTGTYNIGVKLANIKIKDITVNVIPKQSVVLCGNTVGAKLYTNGVLVVGMSEIEGMDSKKYKPYENSGIEEGDRIVAINENSVTSTNDLISKVNKSKRK